MLANVLESVFAGKYDPGFGVRALDPVVITEADPPDGLERGHGVPRMASWVYVFRTARS